MQVNSGAIENELNAISKSKSIPNDLSITYDDMHGLWGGTKITIQGTGSGEAQERSRGNAEPQVVRNTLNQDQLLDLINLLIELKAWEQQTPHRQAVPDESKAALTINIGGQKSQMWEWFNDLPKNKRLIQIKTKMRELVSKK